MLMIPLSGLLLFATGAMAQDDVQILPTPTKLDSSKGHGKKKNTNVESKEIAYTEQVTSHAFKELVNVSPSNTTFSTRFPNWAVRQERRSR